MIERVMVQPNGWEWWADIHERYSGVVNATERAILVEGVPEGRMLIVTDGEIRISHFPPSAARFTEFADGLIRSQSASSRQSATEEPA